MGRGDQCCYPRCQSTAAEEKEWDHPVSEQPDGSSRRAGLVERVRRGDGDPESENSRDRAERDPAANQQEVHRAGEEQAEPGADRREEFEEVVH